MSKELQMGNFAVGLVTGGQFLSTILTRRDACMLAERGGRYLTRRGMMFCAIACLFSLLSGFIFSSIMAKFVLVLIARIIMGYGKSVILTGNMTWDFHLPCYGGSGNEANAGRGEGNDGWRLLCIPGYGLCALLALIGAVLVAELARNTGSVCIRAIEKFLSQSL